MEYKSSTRRKQTNKQTNKQANRKEKKKKKRKRQRRGETRTEKEKKTVTTRTRLFGQICSVGSGTGKGFTAGEAGGGTNAVNRSKRLDFFTYVNKQVRAKTLLLSSIVPSLITSRGEE